MSDRVARDDKALKFRRDGTATVGVTTARRTTTVVLRAKGRGFQGAPVARVKLGGTDVGTVSVGSATYRNYTLRTNVPAGTHSLAMSFTNDKYVAGVGDRNLWIDQVTLRSGGRGRPASPTSDPTPTTSTTASATSDPTSSASATSDPTSTVSATSDPTSTAPSPASGSVTNGSQITAANTGPGAVGISPVAAPDLTVGSGSGLPSYGRVSRGETLDGFAVPAGAWVIQGRAMRKLTLSGIPSNVPMIFFRGMKIQAGLGWGGSNVHIPAGAVPAGKSVIFSYSTVGGVGPSAAQYSQYNYYINGQAGKVTIYRNHVEWGGNMLHIDSGVDIIENLIDHASTGDPRQHVDNIITNGQNFPGNVTHVLRNHMEMGAEATGHMTSVIFLQQLNHRGFHHWFVQNNYLAGGGYTVSAGGDAGGGASILTNSTDMHYTGNQFSVKLYPNCGVYGPKRYVPSGTEWTGNVWADGRTGAV